MSALREALEALGRPSDIPDGNGRCTSPMQDALFNVWSDMDDHTPDYEAGERLADAAMGVVRAILAANDDPPAPVGVDRLADEDGCESLTLTGFGEEDA